jgi:hypothetical protein
MSKPADIAKNTIIQKRQSQIAKSEKIQVDSDKMLKEHQKLVRILRSPSHKDDLEEAKEQEKSLKEYEKINKSEEIQKSLKHLLMAGAMSAASMAPSSAKAQEAPQPASQPQIQGPANPAVTPPPAAIEVAKQAELKAPDRKHLLESIKFVESSGGKNLNHPVIQHGMNKGDKAIGVYAFVPKTVKDLVTRHKSLKTKYADALNQSDQGSMEAYFKAKPQFEHDLANKFIDEIASRTKAKTPGDYHVAWEHGIGGLNKMHANNKDMSTVERWNKGEAAYEHAKKAHDNRVSLNLSKPK